MSSKQAPNGITTCIWFKQDKENQIKIRTLLLSRKAELISFQKKKIKSRHPNCKLVCFCVTNSASVEGHLNNLLWQKSSSTGSKIAQPDVKHNFSPSAYP
jgi:hypothetical protein